MRFAKLGAILGGFHWLFQLVWDELYILYSLIALLIAGFIIGLLLDIIHKSKPTLFAKHNGAFDSINEKKQTYMAKLQQRKANSKKHHNIF